MYKTTTTHFRKSCTNSLTSHRFVAAYKKPIVEAFFCLSVYTLVAVQGNLCWWQSKEIYAGGSPRKFMLVAVQENLCWWQSKEIYAGGSPRKFMLVAVKGSKSNKKWSLIRGGLPHAHTCYKVHVQNTICNLQRQNSCQH